MIEVKDFDLQKAFAGNETFTSSVVDLLGFNTLAVGGVYSTTDETQTAEVITFQFSSEPTSNFDFSEVVILQLNEGVSRSIPIRSRFAKYVITNTSSTALNMRLSVQAHDDLHAPFLTDDAGRLVLSDETQLSVSIDEPFNLEATQQEVKTAIIELQGGVELVQQEIQTTNSKLTEVNSNITDVVVPNQINTIQVLDTIKLDTTALVAKDYATTAKQTDIVNKLENIRAETVVLTQKDYATTAKQTDIVNKLENIRAETVVLTQKDYATTAKQTDIVNKLENIRAETVVLTQKDYATTAKQTDIVNKLENIRAETVVLTQKDYATTAKQTDIVNKLENIRAETVVLTQKDYATETTLSQLNNKITLVNTDEIKTSDEVAISLLTDMIQRLPPRISYGLSYSSSITADKYVLLIDTNNDDYPHNSSSAPTQGDVMEIDKLHIKVRFTAASSSAILTIKLGVITRVDATNADIRWLVNVPLRNGETEYKNDYLSPLRFQATQDEVDVPFSIMTNNKELNNASVNTATTLENMTATATAPQVGDVIAYFDWTDNVEVGIVAFYRSNV